MVYLPVEHIKPGMVVAHDVASEASCLSLITAGQKLNASNIKKLIDNNVAGVYICSSFCAEVEPEPLIPPEVKKKTIQELKSVFNTFSKKSSVATVNYSSVRKTAENLISYSLSKDECLLNIIEIKSYDDYTYTHSMYVGILSAIIGMKMNLTKAQQLDLCTCGLLHDVGKLDISLDIINKPEQLSEKEFAEIKTHPDKAVERLRQTSGFSMKVLSGIRTHHEWMDGTGYPLGLVGEEIPLYGRILALADVFDALTSSRAYRKAWASSEAIEYIMGGAQTHFDHEVLHAFLHAVAAYPVGTIVKLSNGDVAIVIKNSPENTLRPTVKVFSGVSQLGKEIDLANDFDYLSVTVESMLTGQDKLPKGISF